MTHRLFQRNLARSNRSQFLLPRIIRQSFRQKNKSLQWLLQRNVSPSQKKRANYLAKIVTLSDTDADGDSENEAPMEKAAKNVKSKRKVPAKAAKKSAKGRAIFKKVQCSLCEQNS